MPFVKRGGREAGKRKRGSGKEGKEEEGSDRLSCKGVRISRLNPCSKGEKDKNPDSFNHHSHHSTVTGRKKKNQWLTAFNQFSALGRSIQNEGARRGGCGGAYRSVFTYAVKHYFTARVTISISQRHSLFKQGESRQRVSFLFGRLSNGQQSRRQWAPTMAMNGQAMVMAIKVLFTWHKIL